MARAVREKENVKEDVREEDKLCVICQDRPKAPVQVRCRFGESSHRIEPVPAEQNELCFRSLERDQKLET